MKPKIPSLNFKLPQTRQEKVVVKQVQETVEDIQ